MSRLAKNIIYNVVGQSLVLVLGFISVKYTYSLLGGDIVGIIYFSMMANTTICMILELGICSATVREVSGYFEIDKPYVQEFFRTFSSFYWLLYFLAAVLVYALTPALVEKWIKLNTLQPDIAISDLRILLISSLLSLPKSFYSSVIRGLERMEINNSFDAISIGIQQLGIVLILKQGGDATAVVYWIALSYALTLFAYMLACAYFFPLKVLIKFGFSIPVIKRNYHYTAQMTIISLTALAYLQFDKIILSKILSIEVFGYYYFAYTLVSKGALVTMAISHASFPHLSNLHKTHDSNALIKKYNKMQDVLCFSVIPVFSGIIYFSPLLFTFLFNSSVAETMVLPITLLCLGFYMTGTLTIPNNVAFITGKPNIIARQNIMVVFIVLPLTTLLTIKLGTVGASMSIVIYGLFCYGYSIPKICRECIDIKPTDWYVHIFKIYMLVALTYGATFLLIYSFGLHSFYVLTATYSLATIAMLIGAFHLIDEELKNNLSVQLFSRWTTAR